MCLSAVIVIIKSTHLVHIENANVDETFTNFSIKCINYTTMQTNFIEVENRFRLILKLTHVIGQL